MKQVAFKMKLKRGYAEEYKERHDKIWPELKAALKDAGIHDYSIYLDRETHSLFAVQKLEEKNSAAELPELPIMKKWWDYMYDIMEVNPDHSPVEIPLERMFYLE